MMANLAKSMIGIWRITPRPTNGRFGDMKNRRFGDMKNCKDSSTKIEYNRNWYYIP